MSIKRRTASRYPPEVHDLSFVIAFLSKSSATHKFLCNTLFGALPGRRYTLQRKLKNADVLIEPGLSLSRMAAARRFYDQLGYKARLFATSNDATATRQEATVRLADNALHGLCTLAALTAGETLQHMIEQVVKYGLARQVDVLLLNPLDTRLPSFVLGVFPQRATPEAAVLKERWEVSRQHLDAVGLHVLAHGADGDPPQLSALLQRASSAATGNKAFTFLQVPSITGGSFSVSAPARRVALPHLGIPEPILVLDASFEDSVHLGLKLRGRVLNRDGAGVWIGDGVASLRTLQEALEDQASVRLEVNLSVRKSDLNPKDRMNWPAAERLLQPVVQTFLLTAASAQAAAAPVPPPPPPPLPPLLLPLPSSKKGKKKKKKRAEVVRPAQSALHLAGFLNFAALAVGAFLGTTSSAYERLYNAWFARYFADGWRAWLQEKGIGLRDNFLTSNQYSCITLNADSLLLFYHWLCSHPALRQQVPASAFAFGSQQNENNFRDSRAGQDHNFSFSGFLRRQTLAQEYAVICTTRADMFAFPKHRKHAHADHIRRPPEYLPGNFSESGMRVCLAMALEDATASLTVLGVTVPTVPAAAVPPVLSAADLHDPEDAAVDAEHALIDDDEGDAAGIGELWDSDSEDDDDALQQALNAVNSDPAAAATGCDGKDNEDDDEDKEVADALAQLAREPDRHLHFAEREKIVTASKVRLTVVDIVTGQEIHKARAAAMISGHDKQSADRTHRVRAGKDK